MNLRRVLFWIVVLSLLAWVVGNPSAAGSDTGGFIATVLGWGKSAVTAVIAFIQTLAGGVR